MGLRNGFVEGGPFRSKPFILHRVPFGYKLFRSGRPFSQGIYFGYEISQASGIPCFWFLLAPLDLPFTSFEIPPDFDHLKTYVKSKQIKIKALKSKLKQVKTKQNKKIWTS